MQWVASLCRGDQYLGCVFLVPRLLSILLHTCALAILSSSTLAVKRGCKLLDMSVVWRESAYRVLHLAATWLCHQHMRTVVAGSVVFSNQHLHGTRFVCIGAYCVGGILAQPSTMLFCGCLRDMAMLQHSITLIMLQSIALLNTWVGFTQQLCTTL